MSTRTLQRPAPPGAGVYRLTVDAYHRMIEAGIFDEDDHIELVEGTLRATPPINAGHAGKNKRLNRLFSLRAGEHGLVAVQDPLTLAPHSEPEPDLMLLRPRTDYDEGTNPTPDDTLVVIEISDSSLGYDRSVQLPLYAAARVPEVWLIDLKGSRLEIYRDPGAEGHRQVLIPDRAQTVTPLLLPQVQIRMQELW